MRLLIELIRGNTTNFRLKLTNSDGTQYVPSENDTIIFTLKKSINKDAKAIVIKKISSRFSGGDMLISFEPQDTVDLSEGNYYYDVAICINGNEFYTVISCDTFKINSALSEMEMIMYARS